MIRNELVLGTKTDIWRVDTIGEGDFKHAVSPTSPLGRVRR